MRFARYPAALCPRAVLPAAAVFVVLAALTPSACKRHRGGAPAATAIVTGRALTAEGAPVAGAAIALTADPDDGRVPVATAKTTTTGSFRIERVPTGGYRIRARAAGYVEAMARIEVASPNGKRVELKLAPTVALAGHIQDQRGTPVPLARVLAFAVAEPEALAPRVHETNADERGQFRLSGLGPGAHRLLIEAPGLGTASAGPVRAPDEHVVVILPGEIRAIVGRVTRSGQGARGARVLLGGESVPEPRGVDTDADGAFAFGGLGPGSYAIRAEAGGLIAPVMTEVAVDRSTAQTRRVELALAPGAFARGRVVGEDGHAVTGAAVQIDLIPATGLWPPVLTDADGNWMSAPLGPGSYRVRARHPGFVARRTATVEVKRSEGASAPPAPLPVTLELVRTGFISGRVTDERGAPLSGATVHDRLAETEELGVIWSRLPMAAEAAALPVGAVLPTPGTASAGARRAITDAAGHFVMSDVPPGRVRVEVLNPSSVPMQSAPVTLVPGGRLDVGTLRVAAAVQVTGHVLDADDRPMANVHVTATDASPSGTGPGLYAMTYGDGAFSLPLPAGEHRLTASVPGRPDTSATVRVGSGRDSPAPVTLRFAKGGDRTITGVVRDAEKRPLARARILASTLADARTTSDQGDQSKPTGTLATTIADAGGGFRLTGLSAGPLSLEVRHDDYAPYRQIVDVARGELEAKPLDVQVPVPGGIDGEVHEKITGAPVPGFQIDARGPDGASARFPDPHVRSSAGAGARGRLNGPLRFSLRKLVPGRWTLSVRAAGYQPFEHVVQVLSAGSLGEPSVRNLRLEIERL